MRPYGLPDRQEASVSDQQSPGPWRLEPREDFDHTLVDAGGHPVMDGEWGWSAADARLIAAAPDLLALLKTLIGPNCGRSCGCDAYADLIDRIEGRG